MIERLVAVHTFLRRSARVVHADVTVQGSFVDKSRPTLLQKQSQILQSYGYDITIGGRLPYLAHFSLGYYVQMFSVHVDLLVALTFKAKAADLTSKSFPAEVNVLHVKLQGSFGTQPLLTMVTLKSNIQAGLYNCSVLSLLINDHEISSPVCQWIDSSLKI